MPEQLITNGRTAAAIEAAPARPSVAENSGGELKKKKENKVRSAWISFTGRIVAQCVGAAATVAFGLMFLQRHPPPVTAADHDTVNAAAVAAAPIIIPPARARQTGDAWLAVLPFEDYSAGQTDGRLVDAMTDALIASLSEVQGLRVVSRTSSMHHKGSTRSLPEVARELAVNWIVEGSIYRVRDQVRVTGQLIDATSDEHVWAQAYDRPFADLLALQSGIATAIARSVDVALHERKQSVPQSDVSQPEADHQFLPVPVATSAKTGQSLRIVD